MLCFGVRCCYSDGCSWRGVENSSEVVRDLSFCRLSQVERPRNHRTVKDQYKSDTLDYLVNSHPPGEHQNQTCF